VFPGRFVSGLLDAQHIAGGVPNLKNGGILRILLHALLNSRLTNPNIWEFSPCVGIGDFDSFASGL
jgi:hypothetical protein